MRRIVLHIDRLVLRGFAHSDRHGVAEGLRQELARIFADRAAVSFLSAMGDVPRFQVSGVSIAPGTKSQRVGENVAQGIGKEMMK